MFAGEKSNKIDKSVFVDCPDFKKYSDLIDWRSGLFGTANGQLVAVPDTEYIEGIGDVYIFPLVSLFTVYATMFSNYGALNYPPAGLTYGRVSVNSLLETDYGLYQDELKTNKINIQKVTPRGAMFAEQRTLYALDSDLSYASSVWIMRNVKDNVTDFMSQFTFRFKTPQDLLIIENGLKGIMDRFVANSFVYQYTLSVPTFAQAQSSGRETNIEMSVITMKDSEEINIRVVLRNAA
jgi:hypothetical protein